MLPLLPDEIVLYKILPLLPWKTLFGLRCVCKSWDSFISHPSFLRLGNNPSHHFYFLSPHPHSLEPCIYCAPHPDNGIVTTPLCPSFLFSVPDLDFSKISVLSVNGLLCIHPKTNVSFYSYSSVFTLIANPTTGQVITLPTDHSLDPRERMFSVSTQFGYDPVGDQFKVLRFVMYQNTREIETKVFTLGDTSWGFLTHERSFAVSAFVMRGLCVNGAIYWRMHDSRSLAIFDVATPEFTRRMHTPPGDYRNPGHVSMLFSVFPDLAVVDGCLCLPVYNRDGLKLWILRDYQNHVWEQKTIVLPPPFIHTSPLYPLCTVPTGEILFLPLFQDHTSVNGVYYDMNTESSRVAVIMEIPSTCTRRFRKVDIFFCQESSRLLN